MSDDAFTAFVRAVLKADQPTEEEVRRCLTRIRMELIRMLRTRGLWQLPPTVLGLVEGSRWTAEALDELVVDAYVFVFQDRLRGIVACLHRQTSVTPLVRTSLQHFVFERQRANDPLGYRVFQLLESAVRRSLDAGSLVVLEGDEQRLDNRTLLALPGASTDIVEEASARFESEVASWCDRLLPGLITANGRAVVAVRETIEAQLGALVVTVPGSFRFKRLVDALKREVRARWRETALHADGEVAADPADTALLGRVQRSGPETSLLDRDAHASLCRCVEQSIQSEPDRALRADLWRSWRFLRSWVADPPADDTVPSTRAVARLLGSGRRRAQTVRDHLAVLAKACTPRLSRETSQRRKVSG